jgi:hypothetical protein
MATDKLRRLINGDYSYGENIVARCHIMTHRGYLSKALVKSHDCIAKKCTFFEKLRPEYWRNIESKELARKQTVQKNRSKKKREQEERNDRDELIRETLEDSGSVHVTAIHEKPPRLIEISYIYDRRVNLAPEIEFLRTKLGKAIKLQACFAPEENIEELIRKPRREMRQAHNVRKAPLVGDATKKRLSALGIYCLEDLFGRSAQKLYELDCKQSGETVNRRYLVAYQSAVEFAKTL